MCLRARAADHEDEVHAQRSGCKWHIECVVHRATADRSANGAVDKCAARAAPGVCRVVPLRRFLRGSTRNATYIRVNR